MIGQAEQADVKAGDARCAEEAEDRPPANRIFPGEKQGAHVRGDDRLHMLDRFFTQPESAQPSRRQPRPHFAMPEEADAALVVAALCLRFAAIVEEGAQPQQLPG